MTQPLISVVIPFFNEERTVEPLFQRIDQTFKAYNAPYEIIAVDDDSTDNTLHFLNQLKNIYPVSIYTKPANRPRGKAFSLLEGFQKARTSIIVMIDGDLQYPPEAIPAMLAKLGEADVIVANRTKNEQTFFRRAAGRFSQKVFAEFMHGIHVDAQSGLKVIRKEVIDRITLHPTSWTFDIELLVKAQHAGYKVASVPITLSRRAFSNGKSPFRVVKTGAEIGSSSVGLKLTRPDAIPFTAEMTEREGTGFHYNGQKYIPHSKLPAHQTALYRLAYKQRAVIGLLVILFIISALISWHTAIVGLVAALTFLYFTDLLFNLYLIFRSIYKPNEIKVSSSEINSIAETDWPTYSIFCPLYKEPEVIPQFVKAMSQLDYPEDKLQVMLLLEEDDKTTIAKAQAMDLPSYFEIVVVPHSLPKTKPKACNYGLLKARGEYCVIYDAEDVPDTDQLKKAVIAFREAGMSIACIQAKLNFYNSHQNILTRAFTMEYSLWFDLVLTGLQSIHAPIPLGGTSNHFRTAQLKSLNGWDAFNVTEDCDLGMRLVKQGYKTAVLDSITLEEATSNLMNWINQRSRWIKGYMQTYLVHMRNPKQFIRQWNEPHVVTFQLIVGGKVLSMFINPLMWVITFSYFAFRPIVGPTIESFFPTSVFYMGIFSFIFGNFLYVYYYMVGCIKRGQDELVKYALFIPLYWLAMSVAAWIAFKDLIVRPHHWAKTKHGAHLTSKKGLAQTKLNIGGNF